MAWSKDRNAKRVWREAVFHLKFRHHPFGGQYAVACGLSQVVDFLRELRRVARAERDLARLRVGEGACNDFLSLFEGKS